jgi:CHAD domain-containing protein
VGASPILKYPTLKPIPKAGRLTLARVSTDRSKSAAKPKLGLRAWMDRVLVECDRAAVGFEADPVHDLRVALRRCRSLADGMIAIDPDSSWKEMKKAGRKVFQALGELRDLQVMEEWIEKLGGATAGDGASPVSTEISGDPVAVKLMDYIRGREAECKEHTRKELEQFDRKQWKRWSSALPQRASRLRPGSPVYLHLALEKWTAAYDLHKHALRTRSQVSLHALRIGIKRFRYTVENFLPRQHAEWGADLKDLQDLLGDVHDLDVLWATAVQIQAFPDPESRNRWREKLDAVRSKKIECYRAKMVGPQSLWRVWHAELPSGKQLREAAMIRLQTWAGYLDPDFGQSQRVTQLAMLFYDGLRSVGLLKSARVASSAGKSSSAEWEYDPREVLRAAAIMREVGKSKGLKNYQKASSRMILNRMVRGVTRPLGLSAREMEVAAAVVRCHCGALPHARGKTMQSLELADRPIAMELAAVLRLANVLDVARAGRAANPENDPRLEVGLQDRCVLLRVAGYSAADQSAEEISAARHLLEVVLRRPVLVSALRTSISRSRARTTHRSG